MAHEEEKKKLLKEIFICNKVKATLDSEGWKETIAPIIDRMIIDIVGGKIGDNWTGGLVSKAKTDEKREFYIGRKDALMELHNRVMFHLTKLKQNEKRLKDLEEEELRGNRVPMVEDSRYAP